MALLRDFVRLALQKQVPRAAAQLAYYLVLTIFPLLICVNAFLGLLDLSNADLITQLRPLLPVTTYDVITDFLHYVTENYSHTMLVAALMVLMTAASAAFRAIQTVMAELEDAARTASFAKTVLSFVFALGFLLAMYVSCIVILTGQWFVNAVTAYTGHSVFTALWPSLRFVLLFLLLFAVVYAIYRLSAPKAFPRRQRVIGAMAAALAMAAAGVFFSWTIALSSKYPLIYGSLASVILLMLWLFICGNILILGNALNVVLNRRFPPRGWHKHGRSVH